MRRSSSRRPHRGDASAPVHPQLDGRHAAVQGRTVVLNARRYADRLALDVHGDLQQLSGSAEAPVQWASAPHAAIVSADEPAMPAPAGDSPRVVSVAFSSR